MKILIVCSINRNKISPFILEQANSIVNQKPSISFDYFTISGRGAKGYSKNYFLLKKTLKKNSYGIIHAHYGLSGLLANLQRKVPVITTFHGSDINNLMVNPYSQVAIKLSVATIFVNRSMLKKSNSKQGVVIPCGIETKIFNAISKEQARKELGLKQDEIFILFSSSFSNGVKNFPLAREACDLVQSNCQKKINLIELKNYSRQEVNFLINASDCALLTSFSEGSPQFVKEAMACNLPLVSTNVGDVAQLFGNEPGHYLVNFDAFDVANKIKSALDFAAYKGKTQGRKRIIKLGLNSENTAERIISLYESVLKKKTIK